MLNSFYNVEVGTRLLVRPDLEREMGFHGWGANSQMASYAGQIVTVFGFVFVDKEAATVDGLPWGWPPEMFECIIDDDISLLDLLSGGGTSNADTSD